MASAPAALLHNWRLKLSAFGLAVFFWALVQTEPRNSEVFPAVPVEVAVVDTMWTLASSPAPMAIELRLGGPAREIIRLARDGAVLRLPIDVVGSADTVVTLRREWVDLGAATGLTIESIAPEAVRLTFERAMTRSVRLVARIQGDVPGNSALAMAVTIEPAQVLVRGPRSTIAALDSLPLLPFDLGTAQETDLYPVGMDTTGLGNVSIDPPVAALGIRLEERMERTFPGVPIELGSTPLGPEYLIDPVSIGLRVVGARSLVGALDPLFLRVWVDPEGLLDILPGEERRLPLRVDGVPELVTAIPGTDVVTVRRETAGGGSGGSGGG